MEIIVFFTLTFIQDSLPHLGLGNGQNLSFLSSSCAVSKVVKEWGPRVDQVVAVTINQETLDLESEGEWPSSRVKCRYEHWFMGWCHL